MTSSQFARGVIVKCLFPFDTDPSKPGPVPHYCLVVDSFDVAGEMHAAVCYGTSRLDDFLLHAHGGMILDVPSTHVNGAMPGSVTHFVADHVATIKLNDEWYYSNFRARLNYIRDKDRDGDFRRQRLYDDFLKFEAVMKISAAQTMEYTLQSGLIGLPAGKTLR